MDLNLKGVDETLVSRAKMAAYGKDQTLKEWVIDAISEKLGKKPEAARERRERPTRMSDIERAVDKAAKQVEAAHAVDSNALQTTQSDFGREVLHDTKSCRVYACGMCKAANVKDKRRGLL